MIKPHQVPNFKKGLMVWVLVLFVISLFTSGCSVKSQGFTKTDWMWMQMTEEQKKEAIAQYYSPPSQTTTDSPQTTEQPQQCPETLNALHEELTQLRAENARLQAQLSNKKHEDMVIFMPPLAF